MPPRGQQGGRTGKKPDDVTRDYDPETPSPAHGSQYNFMLQIVVELQRSHGGQGETLKRIEADVKGLGEKLDKLLTQSQDLAVVKNTLERACKDIEKTEQSVRDHSKWILRATGAIAVLIALSAFLPKIFPGLGPPPPNVFLQAPASSIPQGPASSTAVPR